MAKYSFDYVMQDAITFIVSPGCKTANSGYFTNLRVDRGTLPEGWYAYDIRHGDSGGFYSIEEFVLVNHAGTFLTQKPMKMNSRGFHCLRGGGGYSFGDPYKERSGGIMHQVVLLDSEDMEKLNSGEEIELSIGFKCNGQFFNRTDLLNATSIVLRKAQKVALKTSHDIFEEFKQKFNIKDQDVNFYRHIHDGEITVWFNDDSSIIYATDNLYKEG